MSNRRFSTAPLVAFTTGWLLLGVFSAGAVVTLDVKDTTVNLGETAVVNVDIVGIAADGPAGGLDFDLIVDGDVFEIGTRPDCTIQFPVQSNAFVPPMQPNPPLRRIRFSAADLQPGDPLSRDGTLWSCNLPVRDDADEGKSEIIIENLVVFDRLGLNEIDSQGDNGLVSVQAEPCDGDANGDREVTVEELVRAVANALNGCP